MTNATEKEIATDGFYTLEDLRYLKENNDDEFGDAVTHNMQGAAGKVAATHYKLVSESADLRADWDEAEDAFETACEEAGASHDAELTVWIFPDDSYLSEEHGNIIWESACYWREMGDIKDENPDFTNNQIIEEYDRRYCQPSAATA